MRAKVTQSQIAEKLGLSRVTVNRVLCGDPDYPVSRETRHKILAMAMEMGCRPYQGLSENIACIFCNAPLRAHQYQFISNLYLEAIRLRQNLVTIIAQDNPSFKEISISLRGMRLDGAIVTGGIEPEVVSKLQELMPVVIAGEYPDMPGVDRVLLDYNKAGREATNYLLAMGHRRIMLLMPGMRPNAWQDFYRGYRQSLEERDIPFEPWMLRSRDEEASFYPDFLKSALSGGWPAPTAIISCIYDDHCTIMTALSLMGYDIPGDISYLGWHSLDMQSLNYLPKMTRLANDNEHSLVRTAMRRLYDRIRDNTLPPELFKLAMNIEPGRTCRPLEGHDGVAFLNYS